MDLGCQALYLTPSWKKGSTILVQATDAIRLRHEGGYEEVCRARACEEVSGFDQRGIGSARAFVSSARLTTLPLALLEDWAVLVLLMDRVRLGQLVVLRADPNAAKVAGATVEQRRLIASIESKTRGKLSYLGRQYRLVADGDLPKVPQRESYEVVRHEEGVRTLDGLAGHAGTSGELRALLTQARGKLAKDWRPPQIPDGLVLLRRVSTPVAPRPDTAVPITPSQLKTMIEQAEQEATLEIVVLGIDDKPLPGIAFTFEAPDEEQHKGELGSPGKITVKSRKPGRGLVTVGWKKTK